MHLLATRDAHGQRLSVQDIRDEVVTLLHILYGPPASLTRVAFATHCTV